MPRLLAVSTLLFLSLFTAFTQPKTIRVPQDQATIQGAIDVAVDGDTVLVGEGTYFVNLVLTKKIVLGSRYIIDGDTSHISKTILDGSTPRHADSASVVTVDGATDTTLVIAGFTITKGKGNRRYDALQSIWWRTGTGIDIVGGGARVVHNIVCANNRSGASDYINGTVSVWNPQSQAGVSFVILEHNTICDNVFSGQYAEGAGLAIGHNAIVRGNTIIRNTATGSPALAGGVSVWHGTVLISSNLIANNYASHRGGGLAVYGNIVGSVINRPTVQLENNILTGNSAGYYGGGIEHQNLRAKLYCVNNTIVGNVAFYGGSGIDIDVEADTKLLNTILWNPSGSEVRVNSGGVLTASYSCIRGGWSGEGNLSADPLFVTSDPLFPLQHASACINAGMMSATVGSVLLTAPATDYNGHPRPQPFYSHPDLGAMESAWGRGTIRVPEHFASIQRAIDASVNGDTVLVDDGSYFVNLVLTKKITLASRFIVDGDTSHISRTILDGSAPSHADSGSVIQLENGTDSTTIVTGFTITNGRGMKVTWPGHVGYYGGGVIFKEYGGGTLRKNTIQGNTAIAPSGGYAGAAAICVWNGSLTSRPQRAIIEHNLIQNNTVTPTDNTSGTEAGAIGGWAGYTRISGNVIRNNHVYFSNTTITSILGGGVIVGTASGVESIFIIVDNTFEGNTSYRGGGLAVYGNSARVTVQGNRFVGNVGSYGGGGLLLWSQLTNAVISGNYFSRNTSPRGAAIAASTARSALIENNIIANNTSTQQSGAGLWAYNCSDLRIVNNTFANNSGSGAPGLYFEENTTGLIANKVLNCIIWGSTAPSVDMYTPTNHIVRSCIIKGGWTYGTNIYNVDPWFVANDTLFHPSETANHVSPVFGRGEPSLSYGMVTVSAPLVDYFGSPRPRTPGSMPDLGAIESDLTTLADENTNPIPQDFGLDQNYPNPFNPETKIGYRMKERGWVEVSVMNNLGQRVAVLVEGEKSAGYHEAVFGRRSTVDRLPSGIYFYRMTVRTESGQRFESVRKMVLMK